MIWSSDLDNWDSIANDANGDGDYLDSGEEVAREHNFANEIEEIGGVLPFAYDKAGNMTDQDLPSLSTKSYIHDAWNRLVSIEVDEAVLGEYEYNALHWRSVKRSRSLGAGSLDEMSCPLSNRFACSHQWMRSSRPIVAHVKNSRGFSDPREFEGALGRISRCGQSRYWIGPSGSLSPCSFRPEGAYGGAGSVPLSISACTTAAATIAWASTALSDSCV